MTHVADHPGTITRPISWNNCHHVGKMISWKTKTCIHKSNFMFHQDSIMLSVSSVLKNIGRIPLAKLCFLLIVVLTYVGRRNRHSGCVSCTSAGVLDWRAALNRLIVSPVVCRRSTLSSPSWWRSTRSSGEQSRPCIRRCSVTPLITAARRNHVPSLHGWDCR